MGGTLADLEACLCLDHVCIRQTPSVVVSSVANHNGQRLKPRLRLPSLRMGILLTLGLDVLTSGQPRVGLARSSEARSSDVLQCRVLHLSRARRPNRVRSCILALVCPVARCQAFLTNCRRSSRLRVPDENRSESTQQLGIGQTTGDAQQREAYRVRL